MISKYFAERMITTLWELDKLEYGKIWHKPHSLGYEDWEGWYPNQTWRKRGINMDLLQTRLTLDAMRESYREQYDVIKVKLDEGGRPKFGEYSKAIRRFRQEFDLHDPAEMGEVII